MYTRGVNKLRRLRGSIPMAASFFLSKLQGRHWPVVSNGTKVYLGYNTPLHHHIAKQESKGRAEKKVLEYWLTIKAGVVYDIGGYNGVYGLLYAASYPDSRVTIFEPDAINYRQIADNIRLNRLSNCTAERVAISDTEGVVLFSQGGRTKERIVERGGTPVPTFPLSHYPKADLIKIDVEGAEGGVLRGLGYAPKIVLELHGEEYLAQYGDTPEDIWKRITELGLTPQLINDRGTEQHYFLSSVPV